MEYAPKGIRINAVSPGSIQTPLLDAILGDDAQKMAESLQNIPLGRLGQPEEIAKAALWLCSPDASYLIGHALPVDGGIIVI